MSYISTQNIWKAKSEIRNQWLNCGKDTMKNKKYQRVFVGEVYKCEGLKLMNIWKSGTESCEKCGPQFREQ